MGEGENVDIRKYLENAAIDSRKFKSSHNEHLEITLSSDSEEEAIIEVFTVGGIIITRKYISTQESGNLAGSSSSSEESGNLAGSSSSSSEETDMWIRRILSLKLKLGWKVQLNRR